MVAECKDRDFSSNARTIRLFRRAVRLLRGEIQKKPLWSERLFGESASSLRGRRTTVPMKVIADQRTTVFPCRLMTNVPGSGC